MGRVRLSPFRGMVSLSRPDAALSRLAASLHGAIVSTAGRERLREALEYIARLAGAVLVDTGEPVTRIAAIEYAARDALDGSGDPEAVGLDEAWAEADAALPSDGSMRLTGVTWPSMKDDEWVAHCSAAGVFGYGPTPAAALRALAAALTEAKPESPA
jgi:hypothetical protein